MRILFCVIGSVFLACCSTIVSYVPEYTDSCGCYEFDSLFVITYFDNALVYPLVQLRCELPEHKIPELNQLDFELKRTEDGFAIFPDSIAYSITNDSGYVLQLNSNKWPTELPDSMHIPSGKVTLQIDKHYSQIRDEPDRWFVRMKVGTLHESRDTVFSFKAEKRSSVIHFH